MCLLHSKSRSTQHTGKAWTSDRHCSGAMCSKSSDNGSCACSQSIPACRGCAAVRLGALQQSFSQNRVPGSCCVARAQPCWGCCQLAILQDRLAATWPCQQLRSNRCMQLLPTMRVCCRCRTPGLGSSGSSSSSGTGGGGYDMSPCSVDKAALSS
jgi:hypothetical protein